MTPPNREIFIDITKFILTGIVSFACSVFYTNYKTDASRNLFIIPMRNEFQKNCTVDQAKKDEVLNTLKNQGLSQLSYPNANESNLANEEQSGDRSYRVYLEALKVDHLVEPSKSLTNKADVPNSIFDRLKKDGIVNCLVDDPSAKDSIFTISTVVLLGEPGETYISSGDCIIKYNNTEIPVRVRPQERLDGEFYKKTSYIDSEKDNNDPLILSQPKLLQLRYDKTLSSKVIPETMTELSKRINEKETYEYKLECIVISKDGTRKPVGTDVIYQFRGNELIEKSQGSKIFYR